MKYIKTEFICNHCNKSIVIPNDNFDGSCQFPYDSGWIFIYNLEFKVEQKLPLKIAKEHFCSKKCLTDHIRQRIKEHIVEQEK